MWAYWGRIVGAWLLLQFASRVMKQAEQVLRTTVEGNQLPEPVADTNGEVEA